MSQTILDQRLEQNDCLGHRTQIIALLCKEPLLFRLMLRERLPSITVCLSVLAVSLTKYQSEHSSLSCRIREVAKQQYFREHSKEDDDQEEFPLFSHHDSR